MSYNIYNTLYQQDKTYEVYMKTFQAENTLTVQSTENEIQVIDYRTNKRLPQLIADLEAYKALKTDAEKAEKQIKAELLKYAHDGEAILLASDGSKVSITKSTRNMPAKEAYTQSFFSFSDAQLHVSLVRKLWSILGGKLSLLMLFSKFNIHIQGVVTDESISVLRCQLTL